MNASMPKKRKHSKKHIVTMVRGKPVKGRRAKRDAPGRPRGPLPADPELANVQPTDTVRTQVRSTTDEELRWKVAAAIESSRLELPPGATLSIGPWGRRAMNRAADALNVPTDPTALAETARRLGVAA